MIADGIGDTGPVRRASLFTLVTCINIIISLIMSYVVLLLLYIINLMCSVGRTADVKVLV